MIHLFVGYYDDAAIKMRIEVLTKLPFWCQCTTTCYRFCLSF